MVRQDIAAPTWQAVLRVDLRLDRSLANGYVSASQIARRVTEPWAERNLYCPACPSPELEPAPTNTAVLDFRCRRCGTDYQLKSKSGPFGRRVQNSAYQVKVRAIDRGEVPNYVFLEYSRSEWIVRQAFVIPGHFVTRAIVEERKPLAPSARRAGWIGSNLLLHALPMEARVSLVADAGVVPRYRVRRQWRRFAFLGEDARARGGWGAEVLACVRRFQDERDMSEFTLREFYERFEATLAASHPANRHVRAKMRQQLQVLRDGGVVEFVGAGRYRVIA